MNSLDFNLALNIVSCTLSSFLSTSKVFWVKCFTYDLKISFSPCLMVSRWSAGLFRHCPSMKWHTKELPNCLKLSMDDVGSLVNHSFATPLRMVGKERHNISSGGCWRPRVVLMVLRWSKGSFRPSNASSYGRRNFEGTGHSRTTIVEDESILLTILSKLRSVFSCIALLNLSISFLISLGRSKLAPFGVASHQLSFLLWISPLSSWLVLDRLSSCYNRSLISWFCLMSSSMLAVSVWICRANAVESWGVLDCIWTFKLNGTTLSNLSMKMLFPQTVPN